MRLVGFLGVAGCLAVSGCGYKGDIVGRWKVDPEFVKKNSSGPQDNFWSGFEHDQRFEFLADHTFTGPLTAGTYAINNGHVELVTTQVRGAKIAKQSTADVSSDGKSMTLHSADDSGLPAALKDGEPLVRDTGPAVGPPVVKMGGGPGGPGAGGARSPSVPANSAPVGGKRK